MTRDRIKTLSSWDKVNIARNKDRPSSKYYIENIFDKFIEFHGDRSFGDDKAVIGGIASLNGESITVIGITKGESTKDNIERNFGMPNPEGYRKSLRLMKQAEKFKRPVICFIDTPGAYPGKGAEERGQGQAIARNLLEMSRLKTPIITIIIGEGSSGGALALAVADKIFMLEHAIYSILTPEGFASILWKDGSKFKQAAEVMKITAQDLKHYNVIDEIIREPYGGAHKNRKRMALLIKKRLIMTLSELNNKCLEKVLDDRYKKFRYL